MALEGLERETSRRVVWRIFETEDERMREIANLIVDVAHNAPAQEGEGAGRFAGVLKRACHEGMGDMDSVLGVSL
jgi:hypothetical protein